MLSQSKSLISPAVKYYSLIQNVQRKKTSTCYYIQNLKAAITWNPLYINICSVFRTASAFNNIFCQLFQHAELKPTLPNYFTISYVSNDSAIRCTNFGEFGLKCCVKNFNEKIDKSVFGEKKNELVGRLYSWSSFISWLKNVRIISTWNQGNSNFLNANESLNFAYQIMTSM